MTQKKTILYISDSSRMNLGGQVSLFNLIKRLDRDRYAPLALCPEPGPLADHLKSHGCPVFLLAPCSGKNKSALRLGRWLSGLRRIVREQGVDLVHTDRPVTTFLAALACRPLGVPVVWHARVSARDAIFDRINPLLVSRIIGVSDAVGERFTKRGRLFARYRTIYNGVDCEKFSPQISAAPFRKEMGVRDGEALIGTVAQLIPQKGIRDFILAASRVVKQNGKCRFVLIGTGENAFEEEMRALVRQEGIERHLSFVGYRDDMPDVLAGLDVLVLASWDRVEGLPRVVIESMASGKPVVGTSVAGISETVEDGVTGLLVAPGDPAALADAIGRIVDAPELGAAMGAAGRARCEQRFSAAAYVQAVEMLYEEILEKDMGSRHRTGFAGGRPPAGRARIKKLYLSIRTALLRSVRPLLRRGRKGLLPAAPAKILVITQPRLGDAVLSIPVLAALRKRYPAAKISALANSYVRALYERVPAIDVVVPLPTGKGGTRRTALPSLSRRLQTEKFDLVIDLNTDGSLESAYLARFAGGGYSLGYEGSGRGVFFDHAVALPEEPLPFVDLVLGLLAPLGVETDERMPRLAMEEDRVQTVRTALTGAAPSMETRFIGLHPGAHHPTQRWPLSFFAALADRIVASRTGRVVLFAGPHEWDQVLQIHELMRETPIVTPASLGLNDLAAWLSIMELLVCNNSGPLHLAAAVGTPTLSFMGPTNAVQWWPVGEGHVVLRRDELPCIGCNSGVCRIGSHDCMQGISPDEVFEIIENRFARAQGSARSRKSPSHAFHAPPLAAGSER